MPTNGQHMLVPVQQSCAHGAGITSDIDAAGVQEHCHTPATSAVLFVTGEMVELAMQRRGKTSAATMWGKCQL